MKKASLIAGIVLVAAVFVIGGVSLLWTPYDPIHVPTGPGVRYYAGPSFAHPLGTDNQGIDVASRMMVGARICLVVGVIAVAIGALAGVPLGMLAGMRRGVVDSLVMRVMDVAFAFPALLLAIVFAGIWHGSTLTAMGAIGIASIPAFARIARAATLPVMAQDYVLAARSSGTSAGGIALRHVLPNIAPVIGVQASVSFGLAILAEAGLSYLGLGTAEPTPTWGRMLKISQTVIYGHPEQALWPGLAIALAVLGFNLLGDGLRDFLDPRLKDVR